MDQNSQQALSIPVLLYHGILEKSDGSNVTLEDFQDQMFTLKKAGWKTVTTDDFYAFMLRGGALPEKSFLLTFDDGRSDSYYPADPILKAMDYHAVMFVITGRSLGIDKEKQTFQLTERELKEMLKSGRWDLQSHGKIDHDFYQVDSQGNKGHFLSNKLWLVGENRIETEEEFTSRIKKDLAVSKQELQNTFGVSVASFAFPFSDFGENTINFPGAESIVLKSVRDHYSLAFYQISDNDGYSFNYPGKDTFLMKRITVKPEWSGADLLNIFERGSRKTLPFADKFDAARGMQWIDLFGSVYDSANGLEVGANAQRTTGAAILDGSYKWTDYKFTAKVRLVKGRTLTLLGRYRDENNYVGCTFEADGTLLRQRVNGEDMVLQTTRDASTTPSEADQTFGIFTHGLQGGCEMNGKAVISTRIGLMNPQGGIGFKTWDPEKNNSQIIVKEVSVENKFALPDIIAPTEPVKKVLVAPVVAQKPLRPVLLKTPPKKIEPAPAPKPPAAPAPAPVMQISLGDGYYTDFSAKGGWINLFGALGFENGTMMIGSNASTTGSLAYLAGSDLWADYTIQTTIDWLKGQSFALVARYKDSKNYISCSYATNGSSVRMTEYKNGTAHTLGVSPRLPTSYAQPWRDIQVGMRLSGDVVECLSNGNSILQYHVATMPSIGGIGVKTWAQNPGEALIRVKSIVVDPLAP